MNDLQSQARRHFFRAGPRPATEQVPSAQAQVFGQQQPDTDLVAGDLVGQQLAHLPLQTRRIGRLGALVVGGALGEDEVGSRFGIKGVEFFLEDRNRR